MNVGQRKELGEPHARQRCNQPWRMPSNMDLSSFEHGSNLGTAFSVCVSLCQKHSFFIGCKVAQANS